MGTFGRGGASVFGLLLAWYLVVAACSSSSGGGARPGGSDGGDATAEGAAPVDPEGMFRAFQAELIGKCGGNDGACHVNGTFMGAPQWLGPPDPYVSATGYPGIIPASNDPLDSKILTQVEHEGPALISSPSLFDRVRAWVIAEIGARGTKLPATDAFSVADGNNEVDLSKLAGGLQGTKITFNASSGNGLLTILNMKITAPFPKALHIEAPFFVIVPARGPVITDTVDGFPGALDVANGQTVDFYGGSAVLRKWDSSSKLKIVFNKFEALVPLDGGSAGACNALSVFKSSAVGAFKTDLGGGNTCQGCHGGGLGPAQFAMDLAALDSDPAIACAQAKNRITPKDPAKSQLLQTPTGNPAGDPSHPVRSVCPTQTTNDAGLSLCVPQSVIDSLGVWINAE
jgi:hypothetical protein